MIPSPIFALLFLVSLVDCFIRLPHIAPTRVLVEKKIGKLGQSHTLESYETGLISKNCFQKPKNGVINGQINKSLNHRGLLGKFFDKSFGFSSFQALKQQFVKRTLVLASALFLSFGFRLDKASASMDTISSQAKVSSWQGMLLWGALFTLSAVLHSAESAITKISTWKIQEFADEEGSKSPFATLSKNITKLLITILLTTTACSIYSTALFVASINQLFPKLSLGAVTAALTIITLFFGELLPKALAVSNSEYVTRKLVPLISPYSTLLSPVTSTVTFLSDLILRMFGMRSEEDHSVSEDMLRLVVAEAQRSNKGIETGEGRMIKNVLDMQDKEVERIMQPRIEVVAVSETSSLTEILQLAVMTKYSRIPVYRADIDHIVGIIFSKDLLDFIKLPTVPSSSAQDGESALPMLPTLSSSWKSYTAKDLMEPAYFIPETMSCWTALQEMRKRRVHMAIVVDEYGGTSGLVTFEDILEEVVGEIYDEDDGQEEQSDNWTIFRNADGTFKMKAYAELDDVFEALNILEERDGEGVGEYSTIGGLLCSIAGRIPQEGDEIRFANYRFSIRKVEDNRRLVDITVSPILAEEGSGVANGLGASDESNSFETESSITAEDYSSSSFSRISRGYSDVNDYPEEDSSETLSRFDLVEGLTSEREEEISSFAPEKGGTKANAADNDPLTVLNRTAQQSVVSSNASNDNSSSGRKRPENEGNEVKIDEKTSKPLIFIDGEWVDPDFL